MQLPAERSAEPIQEGGYACLEREIHQKIGKLGRITFKEFMELALYHPEHGYYRTRGEKLGPRGDFSTSPETHPVFGELIGRQMEQIWHVLGYPDEFTVVEVGAGKGSLCSQILRYPGSEEFRRSLRYVIVENSRELANIQRGALDAVVCQQPKSLRWFEPTSECPLPTNVIGCVISNELIDAFPVHRVMMSEGRLREIYVGQAEGKLMDVVDELSTPALAAYFDDLGVQLPEGARAEVNLSALEWIRSAAASLAAGFVITIDYGFPAEELFSERRREGSLMCYFRHTCSTDPYVRIGKQDMTTHVDFTSLIRAGRTAGLKFVGLANQSDFLTNLGLDAYIAALDSRDLSPAVRYGNKFAMRRLAIPDGLGKFKALVQQKGLAHPELDCFNPCNDTKRELILGKRPLHVPLLGPSSD